MKRSGTPVSVISRTSRRQQHASQLAQVIGNSGKAVDVLTMNG
jgi:hypothetical protein